MPSRHQVREAAVQLFYARASSQGAESDEELWDLINDRAGLTFDRARVKVLAHWQTGRAKTAATLHKELAAASTAVSVADPTGKAARDFQTLCDKEIKFAEFLENLAPLAKANTGGWRQDLYKAFQQSPELKKLRAELSVHLVTFPPLQKEAIDKTFAKLDTFDERIEKTRNPARFPEQRELAHLHKTQQEMKTLREEAEKIIAQVTANLPGINKTIETAAENYDLGRLSRVDLSILRLATWEITHAQDVPNPVAINEAIELARAFSGEDSAAFVNGLLDRIAKDHSPA
ncbi:MAG: transcription antitermination factor NusB [Verrucomicrobiaceae bacterium]